VFVFVTFESTILCSFRVVFDNVDEAVLGR